MSKVKECKKFLEPEELHKIEVGQIKRDVLVHEVTILEQRRDINELYSKIYQHKRTIENFRIAEAKEAVNANAKTQKKIADNLRTKYKIEKDFGYDPRTGEISGAETIIKE